MKERTKFLVLVIMFLIAYLAPFESSKLGRAIVEAFLLVQWYAQEHTLGCVVPALFIAGAIAYLFSQATVMKYLGATANKIVSYGVASVSGGVISVCSCSVLPIFAGIYSRGAGLGPAIAFLYAGPAINVLSMILVARILGLDMWIGHAGGAIVFSISIGLIMAFIFRKEEKARVKMTVEMPKLETSGRPAWKTTSLLIVMILFLIFIDWPKPVEPTGFSAFMHSIHLYLAFAFMVILFPIAYFWFSREEKGGWLDETWRFAKLIVPLLFAGVFVTGIMLGKYEGGGIIPSEWVQSVVGGNSLKSCFFSSIIGALMYFATLTEIPITQGLMAVGMGKGPALTLLLAGPALSLPSMFVIASVIGAKKTIVYIMLVIVMSTLTGWIFGAIVG